MSFTLMNVMLFNFLRICEHMKSYFENKNFEFCVMLSILSKHETR